MGSLVVEKGQPWRLIAPTAPGPQKQGTGGEVILWEREAPGKLETDQGRHPSQPTQPRLRQATLGCAP